MIFDQLSEYFVTNNLFSPQQYGFRKNSSTELTALELLDRLFGQLDKHKIHINFHIDLSKVFDSLWHDILLDKLTHYGITSTADKFMKSYLFNRKQYVRIRDIASKLRPVTTDVPQGSIDCPLLFNILINDIQFNSIVYFRQKSIYMYIIILYNIKCNVYLPLNTDKKINIINFNNI